MNYYTFLESPVDRLLLTSDGEFLTGVYMEIEIQKLLVMANFMTFKLYQPGLLLYFMQ